jgi:hypothetical protein
MAATKNDIDTTTEQVQEKKLHLKVLVACLTLNG